MRKGNGTLLGGRLAGFLRPLAILLLRTVGWRAAGKLPEARKAVVVAGPHTSNWDGVLLVLLGLELRADLRWLGKRELFPWPLAGIMKWLGGVPVNRSKRTQLTEQVADVIVRSDGLLLVITPEGTRSHVDRWKTGFYRIAQLAEVPIALGFVDYATRTGGIGPAFQPAPKDQPMDSLRVRQDLDRMQAFYATKRGLYPEQVGPVRF